MSISIKQIMQVQKDKRFTIKKEYCGFKKPHYVVRFCGEFLASHEQKHLCYHSAVNSNYFIDWN